MINKLIKLPLLLLSALATGACSDANEPEAREVTVNGFKEQDPAGYAAHCAALRQWKASPHQIVCARLDNAPAVSTSERDFLRSLPDSVDIVTMRNSGRLSQADRQDMAVARNDFGTRVLCYAATADEAAEAAAAIEAGNFDGVTAANAEAAEAVAAALAGTQATLMFEGTPGQLAADVRQAFSYFILDATKAADDYDLEYQVRLAMNFTDASRLLICVTPSGNITDGAGVSRNAIAGAATFAHVFSPAIAGISVNDISADYYDPDIIYKRTRGAIQILSPAAK